MAKSVTSDKRENEKKKQAKRLEKQKKKEERKQSGKISNFDDMIAYVDENGVITSTPPEVNAKKEEINPEEIIISTPKKEKEEPVALKGKVEYFNDSKGFGFIRSVSGAEKYFFHVNNTIDKVSENDKVTFELERGIKGMSAINVRLDK